MILNSNQKKDVYDLIPTSYTINNELFYPSIIYANQIGNNQNLPIIILNYAQMGGIRVIGTTGVVVRSAILTIHAITKNYRKDTTYINGSIIVESICNDIVAAIEGLLTESTNGVKIFGRGDIMPAKNLSDEEIYDYVISINLYY